MGCLASIYVDFNIMWINIMDYIMYIYVYIWWHQSAIRVKAQESQEATVIIHIYIYNGWKSDGIGWAAKSDKPYK